TLFDHRMLQHAKIRVVEARTMEEPAVGRTKGSWRGIDLEGIRQKIAPRARSWSIRVICGTSRIHLARIHDVHRTNTIRHICGRAAPQRKVLFRLVHLYRK